MIRNILLDIEGTTTSIDFVHTILFPYSRRAMKRFLTENAELPDIKNYIHLALETFRAESALPLEDSVDQAVKIFESWIDIDRKHTALKAIQGMIWKQGYSDGEYKSHIYDDVPKCLSEWHNRGIGLNIYSSGSIPSQKLLFKYTCFGDLTPLLSNYFDTTTGPKKESASYEAIAKSLNAVPSDILFLSDIEAELDAAKNASFKTTQLVRPGTTKSLRHPTASTFMDISLSDSPNF